MTHSPTALIMGATGGIGSELSRVLLSRGWTVRALHRKRDGHQDGIDWIRGDALKPADVLSAAKGASLIVHAVNPPGYKDWETLVLPMLDATIEAARQTGATVLMPGTVYNFGVDVLPNINEDSPQNTTTKKGMIRVEMERRLRIATEHGLRVLIVRAGDFFGPNAGNSWFAQGMVKAGAPLKSLTYPGKRGVGHQWAYLPDLAEAMMQLVERRDALPAFGVYHFKGHWDHDGTQMVAAIRRASGNPALPLKNFPWKLAKLMSPFVTFFRELREMRYLWKVPVFMDNGRLLAVLGTEPHTPLDEAVTASLKGAGCLK